MSLGKFLSAVRDKTPLTLCVTNSVTINECANGLLAIGASPVMSGDPCDAETLAGLAAATVLNIGTVSGPQLEICLAAGQAAKGSRRPVLLDPVGAGASKTRKSAAARILDEIRPDIVRGNLAEIKALAGLGADQKGVDSTDDDDIGAVSAMASSLAKQLSAVVAVTGPVDVLADGGGRCHSVLGGSPLLTRVTGTGCMLSALMGAYAGAAPGGDLYGAAAAALSHLALAGGQAASALNHPARLGTFRQQLFDRLAMLEPAALDAFEGYRVL